MNLSGLHVLKATVALASDLGIPVTAEGVETSHQALVLRQIGCDHLQGYFIGRPMDAGLIGEMLKAHGATLLEIPTKELEPDGHMHPLQA